MEEVLKINNSIIHMSGKYGEHLAVLDFEYDGEIESFNGVNIGIDEISMNEETINCLKVNKNKAISKLSEPLYSIKKDLWHDIVEENPMSNLLVDALRLVSNCDIRIINSGVLNGEIIRGIVSKKKFMGICPSLLNKTYMKIWGRYFREAKEKAMDSEGSMKDEKCSRFREKYLGRLHILGGYTEHNGMNITKIIIGEYELEDEKWYTGGSSDYFEEVPVTLVFLII
jgi:5'-nucleotidase